MASKNKQIDWYVYIAQCSRGALYTGISNDVPKRIAQHNSGKGSRSVRALGLPVHLVYTEYVGSKSNALKRELSIKKLSRIDKLRLVQEEPRP